MTPPDWIHPIPGLRRDANHRYWLRDHLFPISTTGVLAHGKSAYAMERIEATRNDWEARGTLTHRALELHITQPGWRPDHDRETFGPWFEWIAPLLAHPIWSQVTPIASEMQLCSLDLNLAGTFDGAFVTSDGRRILFDLKTQKRSDAGAYCTRAQLGCYLTMAAEQGLHFDGAATIWARPGRTKLQALSTDECLEAWWLAWGAYEAAHRQF
jgi:hypothetical protein